MTSRRWKQWVSACRPKTLWAGTGPVLVGTSMAYGDKAGHWLMGILALYCSIMFQIGSNLANDYFDCLQGADTQNRLGPIRVTQSGLIKPGHIRNAFLAVFLSTLPAGVCLLYRGGWPILVIGLLSIAAAILYTAKPVAFGYHGYGELFVFIFFGPVAVGGAYYVQALRITPQALSAGTACGFLAVAILVVNNLRDLKSDQVAGKNTLAVLFGEAFSRWEYALALVLAILVIPALLLQSERSRHPYSILAAAVILFALPEIRALWRLQRNQEDYGRQMNAILARTGRLLILFSLTFSLGWLLA